MGLKLGYVNVRGLTADKWDRLILLLADLDFLFIAETWYVAHDFRRRDPRLLASTDPPAMNRLHPGRPKGGIYLLANHEAAGRVAPSSIVITPTSITLTIDQRCRVSGVYYPPSMTEVGLADALSSVSTSTIILGDINTRFRDSIHQSGHAGPPKRLDVVSTFLAASHHLHLKPDQKRWRRGAKLNPQLTVDHCFVKPSLRKSTLRLLDNKSLSLHTDHLSTLHLTINAGTKPTPCRSSTLPRYRISRLSTLKTSKAVLASFQSLSAKSDLSGLTDVDDLNRGIVSLCQDVCKSILGLKTGRSTTGQAKPPNPNSDESKISPPKLPSAELADRLYKRAVATSVENGIILPSSRARELRLTALQENYSVLRDRYTGPGMLKTRPTTGYVSHSDPFTCEQLTAEIKSQSASKGCGIDGIHIRLVKTLIKSTEMVDLLCRLYNLCLTQATIPRAWNETVIHLLRKNKDLPKDVNNVRPITLICIFRKIFERLLLSRFDPQGWARLHPTQAGFRSHYSTYVNAAVVHQALLSHSRPIAIFLDFRSAFDVVDHSKLATVLSGRQCPSDLLSLINSLTFDGVTSQVIVNGALSQPFPRTCGVLQGSPISPLLFNIFIDRLLHLLNADSRPAEPPDGLFYADDGAILARDYEHARSLLRILTGWCAEAGITLNAKKCGHISSLRNPARLFISPDEEIPLVQEYEYLGFPVTANGIDFRAHLQRRVSAAVGRSNFLSLYSNDWGVACRLHVYKQYLAPMFEYGAPLIMAWMDGSTANEEAFADATSDYGTLVGWIGRCATDRHLLTANLCGLTNLYTRFAHLRTAYVPIADCFPFDSPLKVLHDSSPRPKFIANLFNSQIWTSFKATSNFEPTVTKALKGHLRQLQCQSLRSSPPKRHLLEVIPFESRLVHGHPFADITLSAPIPSQEMLFKYRQGKFMFDTVCRCMKPTDRGHEGKYRRAHETCPTLPQPVYLSQRELITKNAMKASLPISNSRRHFTDVDFLLNTGQFGRAVLILSTVRSSLLQFYHETKKNETLSPG